MFGNHLAHCRYCRKQKITTDCINYGCELADHEKCPGYKKYLEYRATLSELGVWSPPKVNQEDVDKALAFLLEKSGTISFFTLCAEAEKLNIRSSAFDEACRNLKDAGRLKINDKHEVIFLPWGNFSI